MPLRKCEQFFINWLAIYKVPIVINGNHFEGNVRTAFKKQYPLEYELAFIDYKNAILDENDKLK